MTVHQPDWNKVERMVGLPDYGVVFCLSPWPDGGWMAGLKITDREWVTEQVGDDLMERAVLTVPGDPDSTEGDPTPDWDTFDGYEGGLNAHGDDAADAIEVLWAKVHGEKNPLRRHQRER